MHFLHLRVRSYLVFYVAQLPGSIRVNVPKWLIYMDISCLSAVAIMQSLGTHLNSTVRHYFDTDVLCITGTHCISHH